MCSLVLLQLIGPAVLQNLLSRGKKTSAFVFHRVSFSMQPIALETLCSLASSALDFLGESEAREAGSHATPTVAKERWSDALVLLILFPVRCCCIKQSTVDGMQGMYRPYHNL